MKLTPFIDADVGDRIVVLKDVGDECSILKMEPGAFEGHPVLSVTNTPECTMLAYDGGDVVVPSPWNRNHTFYDAGSGTWVFTNQLAVLTFIQDNKLMTL